MATTETANVGRAVAARVGTNIREVRTKLGLTQAQLAEKAGMHKLGVAKLEQNLREPAWSTVQALAAALMVRCPEFEEPTSNGPARARGRPRKAPAPKTARKARGK